MTDTLLPVLSEFRRPRWRAAVPVLWRGQSSVQIGDDVIVDRVTREQVSWLVGLDGIRTSTQVAAELPIDPADADRLLRALVSVGGLVDAARMPDVARVEPRERDAILRDFDVALDTYHELPMAFAAIAGRARIKIAIVGTPMLAAALASAAADARIATVEQQGAADLVVLADDQHPDVSTGRELELGSRPHLRVGVSGSRAIVGPLVVPGRTACMQCADLHRRDADPAWPMLSVQLAQHSARREHALDPLLSRAAAVHALLLVRAWADAPDDRGGWADSAVGIRLPGPSLTRIARPPHPLCGCRWQRDPDEGAQ